MLAVLAFSSAIEAYNEGYVQFTSKTDLVDHYITTLGAKYIDSRTLYIDSYNALVLIKKYIKEI